MELQTDFPRRAPRWWQHWLFKAFVLSLVAIFAFYLIERQIGEFAWRNYQRQAKARGVKLQLIDYELAPIPDGENYAAARVFQKLLAADDPIAEAEKVLKLPDYPRGGPKGSEVKPLDLTNRQKGFVNAGWIPSAGANPASDVLSAMERMEPVLAEIRLASSRPKTRWPVDWSKGVAARTPYYGILQNVTVAFSLRARALLALDRPDEALSEIRQIIHADQSLANNPTMISGLVRIAIWRSILEVCRDGIAANKWRDTDLQALAKEAESINFLAEWKFALESERGFGNQQFDKLITADRESFVNLLVNLPQGTKATALSKFVWLVAPRGWLRHNQVDYNKLYDMDLEDIDAEKERISPQFSRAQDFVDERSRSEFADWYYKVGSASAVVTFTGSKRAFMLHSNLQQFRILCAAAQYRRAQGELPETLTSLVPGYLKAIPHDIMDGEQTRYRRTEEGGCVLWSIGINRVDDGGIGRDWTKGRNKDLDWVLELSGP
jgi:hypothetical protein